MDIRGLPFLTVFILLAGCAGDTAKQESLAVTSTGPVAHGDLEGMVMDGEERPIGDVLVTATGPSGSEEIRTDDQGMFYFAQITAGARVLTFDHPRYEPGREVVYVKADATTSQHTTLNLLPSLRPYRTILPPMEGRYTCASEIPIWTGDCMILWETATEQPDSVTTETFDFHFPVGAAWNQVVAQLDWEEEANNQLDGMHLYLSPADEPQGVEEHHTKLAVAEGPTAPLRIDVEAGKPGPGAEPYPTGGAPAQIPLNGMNILGLVYPRGHGADTAGQYCEPGTQKCFLGVGIGFEVRFTLYVAVFYNGEPVPPNFTMLPP